MNDGFLGRCKVILSGHQEDLSLRTLPREVATIDKRFVNHRPFVGTLLIKLSNKLRRIMERNDLLSLEQQINFSCANLKKHIFTNHTTHCFCHMRSIAEL